MEIHFVEGKENNFVVKRGQLFQTGKEENKGQNLNVGRKL